MALVCGDKSPLESIKHGVFPRVVKPILHGCDPPLGAATVCNAAALRLVRELVFRKQWSCLFQ